MASITMRKLVRDTASVIDQLSETGEPVLIVRKGQPVAALVPVDAERAESIALATAPEFKGSLARTDEAAAAGETETLEQIFPREAASAGGSEPPPEGVEPAAEYGLGYVDPGLVDVLSGALVAQMSLRGTPDDKAAGDIPPERIERIQERYLDLARAVVAENIGQMFLRFSTVSDNIVDASRVDKTFEVDRYEHMLQTVTEAGWLSAPQHKT